MTKICENCCDTVDSHGKFLVHLVSQLRCLCIVLCSGKHFPITIEAILDPSQLTAELSPWFWLMKIRYLEYQPAANSIFVCSRPEFNGQKKKKRQNPEKNI